VSETSPETTTSCRRCLSPLPTEARECATCHTLVHAEELARIASHAKLLESRGDLREARAKWVTALLLLPKDAQQALWIRDHTRALELSANQAEPPPPENQWAKKLGPVGPIAILLAKSKALLAIFKLNFLLSLFAFMGFYWTLYGMKFGIGFAVLILIHELGHFIDIKRRGLPAEMPVFLPGLGAYVRWQALGVSLETRCAVSLAGPLAGWIASLACLLLWWHTGNGLWSALARAGAWLNVLNLIPVWMLDGGQAALGLGKLERIALLTVALLLWLGLGDAVFFLVAAGATFRLFTKDIPQAPSRFITLYFIVVLVLLGVVIRIVPGHGFGME
jgi:Zn-dependent protease